MRRPTPERQPRLRAPIGGKRACSPRHCSCVTADNEPGPARVSHEVEGPNQKGVAIIGVDPTGEAAQKALAAGDVILDVAGKPVSTPSDVKSEIDNAKRQGKKAVLMRVQTANGDRFVAFGFPKA